MRFLAVFDGCAEIMAGANERKRNGWGFPFFFFSVS
jgi:hypothetical protein